MSHSEKYNSRLFVWAGSLGLFSFNISEADKQKVLPTNYVRLTKVLHDALSDSTNSSGNSPEAVIMPTESQLHKAIQLAEAELHRQEVFETSRRRAASTWSFSADQLLNQWPDKIDEGGISFNIFEYRLCFFCEAEEWNDDVPLTWLARDGSRKKHSPSVIEDERWPNMFDEPFPTRQLPLNIFLVLLHALSQLYSVAQTYPFRRSFSRHLEQADYLLSLCESDSPSSWRRSRPSSLPFPPPPTVSLPHNFPWPRRIYSWPQIVPRARVQSSSSNRSASSQSSYCTFSSEPGARTMPLISLISKGRGVTVVGSDDRLEEVEDMEETESSSSSCGGSEADDERTSGSFLGPSSSSIPSSPPQSQLDEIMRRLPDVEGPERLLHRTLRLASPPEAEGVSTAEETDDAELVQDLESQLEAVRQGLVRDLFEAVQEADSVPRALQQLRKTGVGAIDPLLEARLDVFDQEAGSYREWRAELEGL
ncbi:unnamed protein product [Sympodiomycopsis kandeliae]